MYYICLELHHFNSIKKIRASVISDILQELKGFEAKLSCEIVQVQSGFFAFAFPHLKPGEERALSLYLKTLQEDLDDLLGEIGSYIFFIDKIDKGNRNELLDNTRKSIIDSKGSWVSSRAEPGLSSGMRLEQQGENYKLMLESDQSSSLLPSFESLFAGETTLSSILDELETSINESEDGMTICLQGADAEGGMCLARNMFQQLLPETAPTIAKFHIFPDTITTSRHVTGVVKTLREELEPHLDSTLHETICLKNTSNRLLDYGVETGELQSLVSDHTFQDAFLQAYVSIKQLGDYWFSQYGFFPVVMYVPENLPSEILEFVAYLLEGIIKSHDGLVVLVSPGSQAYYYLKEAWKDIYLLKRNFLPSFNSVAFEKELSKHDRINEQNVKFADGITQSSRFQTYLSLQGFTKPVNLDKSKEQEQELLPWLFLLQNEKAFDHLEWQILYIIHLLPSFSHTKLLIDYCEFVHIDWVRLSQMLSKFTHWGILSSERVYLPEIVFPDVLFQHVLKSKGKKIRLELAQFLWDKISKGTLSLSLDLLAHLESARDQELYTNAAIVFLEDSACYSPPNQTELIISKIEETKHWTRSTFTMTQIQALVQTLEQLFIENPQKNLSLADIRNLKVPAPFSYLQSLLIITRSFENKLLDDAKKEVKELLYSTQQDKISRALVLAQVFFGNILIFESKLLEAKDYFNWAMQNAIDSKWRFLDFLSSFSEAISLFLSGSYSRVLDLLIGDGKLLLKAEEHRNTVLITQLLFLLGRTYFEIGAYDESSISLQRCMNWNILNDKQANVIWAWIARSQAYKGEAKSALKLLEQLESTLEVASFKAEALSFLDRHIEARNLLKEFLDQPDEELKNSPILFYNWTSGFSNLEDRLIHPPKEQYLLRRFIKAFYAYLDTLCGDGLHSIETLNAITRVEPLSSHDPYRYFYFHWYSQIMPPDGKEGYEDKITILGKGVKCFQEQANRIDEPTHKRTFMKNPWVMQLFEAAAKYNLV